LEIRGIIKKITFLKVVNFIQAYTGFIFSRIIKKPLVFGYPPFLSIELTNCCNLNCRHCPTGLKQLNRPNGYIDDVLFKKIINECSKYTSYLNLYFQGESFLHPKIFEFINYANQNNIYLCISTNGHFLSEKNCFALIKSGLDKIIISLDGITEDTYLKYRKSGDINKVIKGIRNLVNTKQKLKLLKPYIEIQFIVFKHNEHEIDNFKKFTKKLNINKSSIKSAQIINRESDIKPPKNVKYSRYINKNGNLKRKNTKKICWRLWSNPVITWEGDLVPCCFDKHANFILGNLKKHNLLEIWRNNNSKFFKYKYLKNDRVSICENCI